jgi:hypothetical protein
MIQKAVMGICCEHFFDSFNPVHHTKYFLCKLLLV